MRILVVGSGGREHALVWKISQSSRVKKIFAAPGNGGIAEIAEILPIPASDVKGVVAAARERRVDLVVVGPELPLTLGLVDLLEKEKIPVFGPSKEAAQLEGSKGFAKNLLREAGVPTAAFEVFSEFETAIHFLDTQAYPIVIKADGLAGGKGVVIAKDREEAVWALTLCLREKVFGEAGQRVVIEEFLEGTECTFHALVDGKTFLPLESARDYKRVGDGDAGPNTGGMGSVSPNPVFSDLLQKTICEKVLAPTLNALERRGIGYRGVLYAGLMMTPSGPKLLEYNVRFGDPETQALLVRMESDLVDLIEATIAGSLSGQSIDWRKEGSVCVVMAAHGYPGDVRKGDEIRGLEGADRLGVTLFHAGTRRSGAQWLTDGGRVLGVAALGKDLRMARSKAYDGCDKIYWKGVHFRRDIGGGV